MLTINSVIYRLFFLGDTKTEHKAYDRRSDNVVYDFVG